MAKQVCMGAMMQCTMGVAPSTLSVLPINMVQAGNVPAATVMDFIPMLNIAPFGMCQSPSNPVVAAATAAALGVLTPMPCIPMTVSPWSPGSSTVKIKQMAALLDSDTCNCTWGGTISIKMAGQTSVDAT
jgi:hypothetical protein